MMSREETIELLKHIDELNYEFLEKTKKDDDVFIWAEYYSYGLTVRFRNEIIWNSQDDDRGFDEEKNEYEDFKKFLKRKVIAYLKEEKLFLENILKR
jgi:hypothetical protein